VLKKHRELLDMLLGVIKERYPDDISLMIIYGSCVNGTAHEKSDLDMLFIPKTAHGRELARTFILDGIGYDLWGVDWSQLEQFASFDDMRVSVLIDSELVYYATNEDKLRYQALVKEAKAIANSQLTPDLVMKAERRLDTAKQYLGDLCSDMSLTAVGGILMELCNVVCLLNHTYLRFGSKRIVEELSALSELPPGFTTAFRAAIEHTESARGSCATLIQITEQFLGDKKEQLQSDTPDFSGLYEEISSHWNKIRVASAENDAMTTFFAAASLQQTLDDVQESLGVFYPELQFINSFVASNLSRFVEEADKAEVAFVNLLQSHGIPIVRFDDLQELRLSFGG